MSVEREITDKIQEWVRNCGASFAAKLIATYLRDANKRMADIHQAQADSDQELLTRSAHTLKSSSGQVGALVVSALAKEIELASRAARFADIGAALPTLDKQFLLAKTVLETIRPSV